MSFGFRSESDFEPDFDDGLPMFGRHFLDYQGRTFMALRMTVADLDPFPTDGSRVIWKISLEGYEVGRFAAARTDLPAHLDEQIKRLWDGVDGDVFREEHPEL